MVFSVFQGRACKDRIVVENRVGNIREMSKLASLFSVDIEGEACICVDKRIHTVQNNVENVDRSANERHVDLPQIVSWKRCSFVPCSIECRRI